LNEEPTVACSLGAGDLEQRLAAIAEIGATSLIDHKAERARHLLRFRPGEETRRGLEEIVAAEARCCAFLDLTLQERDGNLVLSIEAPRDARAAADQMAAAFAASRDKPS
jgi:hypothetical protein